VINPLGCFQKKNLKALDDPTSLNIGEVISLENREQQQALLKKVGILLNMNIIIDLERNY